MSLVQRVAALLFVIAWLNVLGVAADGSALSYEISLKDAIGHHADIQITLTAPPSFDLQMPVWNALYQVRDFAEHVSDLRSSPCIGSGVEDVRKRNKDTWQVTPSAIAPGSIDPGSGPVCHKVTYRIELADAGPFGAEVGSDIAFFNFAEVLPYLAGEEHKNAPITVRVVDVPQDWKIATGLASERYGNGYTLHASNYDELVDSPTELGKFYERDFDEAGKHYRVVVHGDPKDYDIDRMAADAHKIVRAETEFMHEAPFETYTFLYLVSPNGGGGMEHKYSTAIGLPPLKSDQSWRAFDGVTAHEFFHLWNVKRIRPQSLEPVDYAKEQYTRDLWFSEGFTSTVGEYALLRAGLETPAMFETHIAQAVESFRSRPAHLWQSPEESSLDTWYDKYPYYGTPERSVSYYTSGELIGYTLDLLLRDRTAGKKSLRDVFLWMNEHYAHQERFFAEDEGERTAIETVSGADFKDFFAGNVQHASKLPLEEALTTIGLRLEKADVVVGDPGFSVARNADGDFVVSDIPSQSAKSKRLQIGDQITTLEGDPPGRSFERRLGSLAPGSQLHLTVRRSGSVITLVLPVAGRHTQEWQVTERANATPQQLSRRKAWLNSEDEP